MRVFELFNWSMTWSRFYDERAERVTYSFVNIRKMFGYELSQGFALKCFFNVSPFIFLSIFTVTVTLVLAYMIRIIEGPIFYIDKEEQEWLIDFRNFENCIYYILITMGTGKILHKHLSWIRWLLSCHKPRKSDRSPCRFYWNYFSSPYDHCSTVKVKAWYCRRKSK